MTVLIVDNPFEAGTDLVVRELASAGVPMFRMDMAEFPSELNFRATFSQWCWEGVLTQGERTVDLTAIQAVYWNRPSGFRFSGLSASDEHYARGAARIGFGGVMTSLDVPYLNHPAKASAAEFKPRQLQVARAAGLSVPRTLVTTEADAVRRFSHLTRGPVVTKALGVPVVAHAGGYEALYTREPDLDALEGVELTAHLFQERIEKDFEVRAVFIGDECFCVRIDTESDRARVDWRSDYDSIRLTPMETPKEVLQSLQRYAAVMDLAYFAADFIVQPSGRWLFLEANPSGQWAWANSPDLPVAKAISTLLEEWCDL
ncbi:MvdC/MvdD family ATP grasp protein [Streptomyces sp. NPDC059452]|uniref:MvdC/MvdD family ATP grasp protein n=1 Tax=Streptomyces sp. NPDC059452 TaxID=3346835 RepID=UPI00369BFB77